MPKVPWRSLANHCPTYCSLDLGLPKMDGHALLRLLRGNEQTKHLRVVALTAHAMKDDAEKALAAGFDGYITKPIDTPEIS